MPSLQSPQDMLATELKNIHSAERQLSRAIPRLAKSISSEKLQEMLDLRLEQGGELLEEIDQALGEMDAPKARPKNLAAEGLIQDLSEKMDVVEEESLMDPLLLASIQKIEHYCIAAWGTAASMGRLLGNKQVVKTMERVLKEGKNFDEQLTKLAESDINPRMLEASNAEEQEEGGAGGSRAGRSKSRRRRR